MAVTRLRFSGAQESNGLYYIDLARELSKVNRKLHRQKQIYTFLGGYYVDIQGSRIDFNVAPHTWVTKRAINRGFAIWRKHIAKALEHTEGMTSGKYSDFKVYLNNNHSGSALLAAKDADGNEITGGEWDYSTLISEDPSPTGPPFATGDQFELQIVGPHSGSDPDWARIGLMKSWLDSRPLPIAEDQPNRTVEAKTDPLNNLFDASDTKDDRIDLVAEEGDQRPYDEDTFFGYFSDSESGGQKNLQRVGSAFTVDTSVALAPVPGFQAICGLVQVNVEATTAWELVLDVESVGEAF